MRFFAFQEKFLEHILTADMENLRFLQKSYGRIYGRYRKFGISAVDFRPGLRQTWGNWDFCGRIMEKSTAEIEDLRFRAVDFRPSLRHT